MNLTMRYDDIQNRKLKVIAAYKGKSLNSLITEILNNAINEWEKDRGEIQFQD